MPLIILDTDIGSSTDDLFAMEMLYRYQMPGDAAWAAAMLEKIRMFNKIH